MKIIALILEVEVEDSVTVESKALNVILSNFENELSRLNFSIYDTRLEEV